MKKAKFDLSDHYNKYLASLWRKAPFVLRITEWKDYPVPVLVIKERYEASVEKSVVRTNSFPGSSQQFTRRRKSRLVERGHLVGKAQGRCLLIIRKIVERVCDNDGIPFELDRYITREGLKQRLNLPLDDEAGAKLGLFFRLQERIVDLDRVELMARRVARFTREEAAYWLSRTTSYGPDANRWAISGLRVVLGGQPQDPGIERMLEQLQNKE